MAVSKAVVVVAESVVVVVVVMVVVAAAARVIAAAEAGGGVVTAEVAVAADATKLRRLDSRRSSTAVMSTHFPPDFAIMSARPLKTIPGWRRGLRVQQLGFRVQGLGIKGCYEGRLKSLLPVPILRSIKMPMQVYVFFEPGLHSC